MAKKMLSSLILSNQQIRRILKDRSIVSSFPALQPYTSVVTKRTGGCGGCGGKKNTDTSPEIFGAVRVAIINLPAAQQEKLRDMLGAAQLSIPYRDSNGKSQHAIV